MRIKKLTIELTIALLVIMFLHTAISKFIDFKGFTYDLDNQPFPNRFTPVLAWSLPLAEIAIVLCLCFEKTRLFGLHASLFLMIVFTIYTAMVLVHVFEYVPCSCGGVVSYLSWHQHLIFNLFFVAITYLAILFNGEIKHHNYYIASGSPHQKNILGRE